VSAVYFTVTPKKTKFKIPFSPLEPSLHESRHKHAMRRPRGPGGRFLTAAEIAELDKQKVGEPHSNSGNMHSEHAAKDVNGHQASPMKQENLGKQQQVIS